MQLVLGAASYGRGWTLQSSGNALLGAPTVEANQAGPYTREKGLLAYFEILSLRSNGFRTVFHNWTKTNYGAFDISPSTAFASFGRRHLTGCFYSDQRSTMDWLRQPSNHGL
jgi:GH18 family chitinase